MAARLEEWMHQIRYVVGVLPYERNLRPCSPTDLSFEHYEGQDGRSVSLRDHLHRIKTNVVHMLD